MALPGSLPKIASRQGLSSSASSVPTPTSPEATIDNMTQADMDAINYAWSSVGGGAGIRSRADLAQMLHYFGHASLESDVVSQALEQIRYSDGPMTLATFLVFLGHLDTLLQFKDTVPESIVAFEELVLSHADGREVLSPAPAARLASVLHKKPNTKHAVIPVSVLQEACRALDVAVPLDVLHSAAPFSAQRFHQFTLSEGAVSASASAEGQSALSIFIRGTKTALRMLSHHAAAKGRRGPFTAVVAPRRNWKRLQAKTLLPRATNEGVGPRRLERGKGAKSASDLKKLDILAAVVTDGSLSQAQKVQQLRDGMAVVSSSMSVPKLRRKLHQVKVPPHLVEDYLQQRGVVSAAVAAVAAARRQRRRQRRRALDARAAAASEKRRARRAAVSESRRTAAVSPSPSLRRAATNHHNSRSAPSACRTVLPPIRAAPVTATPSREEALSSSGEDESEHFAARYVSRREETSLSPGTSATTPAASRRAKRLTSRLTGQARRLQAMQAIAYEHLTAAVRRDGGRLVPHEKKTPTRSKPSRRAPRPAMESGSSSSDSSLGFSSESDSSEGSSASSESGSYPQRAPRPEVQHEDVTHTATDPDKADSPVTDADAVAAAEADSPVMDADAVAAAEADSPVTDADAVAAAEGDSPVMDADAVAAAEGDSPVMDADAVAAAEGDSPVMDADAAAAAEGDSPVMDVDA